MPGNGALLPLSSSSKSLASLIIPSEFREDNDGISETGAAGAGGEDWAYNLMTIVSEPMNKTLYRMKKYSSNANVGQSALSSFETV